MLVNTAAERTDSELIDLVRAGQTDAFASLVERYEPAVAATVVGMLGRCAEARDVGQQVFIRFFRAIDDFRGDSSLKTYLTRIAINLSLNELKRRQRLERRFTDLDEGTLAEAESDTSAGADERLEAEEKSRIVRRAISRLDPRFSSVVTLKMIQGYSVNETANILEVPIGTVLSRLARARQKLAEALAPYVESGDVAD